MKVLHLIDTLGRGGSETLLLDVCKAKNPLFENIVLASGGGVLESYYGSSGVKLIRHDRTLPIDFSLVRKIKQIIKQEQVDVVHSHQPVCALHGLLATFLSKVPVVHSIHGYTEDVKNKLVFKLILSLTNKNILVSESMKEMVLEKEWVSRIPSSTIVYNGVNSERIQSNNNNIRKELGFDDGSVLVGMVGNIYNVKDQLTICKAMKVIVEENSKVHCLLVGRIQDTTLFNACLDYVNQNNLQDNVHFLGERQDVGSILTLLDVFIFSTIADTFGLALIEAMMCGLPCVVSDIKVMKEITLNGKYAKLFPLGNSLNLANSVLQLLHNKEMRAELGAEGRNWAIRNFSLTNHIESLHGVYSSIL